MWNHKNTDIATLLAGLAMLVAGLYWMLSSITVRTGFYALRLGGFSVSSGLTVVPFLLGVVLLFFNFKSIPARLLTGCGLLVIIASVVMGTQLSIRRMSLYELLVMLVLVAGGAVLTIKALWGGKKTS